MDFRLILIFLIGLPLVIGIGVLTLWAGQAQRQVWQARTWLQTGGWVVGGAGVETAVQPETVRIRRKTSSGYRLAQRYAPRVVYEYEVQGRRYRSERLFLGQRILSSDLASADRLMSRYPVGSQVTVYYQPTDPSQATLEVRLGWGTIVLWLVILLLLIILGLLIWLIWQAGPMTMAVTVV